jgi:phasin
MSKTTEKTAETIENAVFQTFDPTDQFRAVAEKGAEQSKEVFSNLKSGAETTQKALESTFETAKTAGSELSLKTIAALRANAEANFSHLEALVGAKSLSEVVELQTAFLRKRVEMTVEQAKDFQAVTAKAAKDIQAATTKATEDVSKPIKDVFEKALKDLKVA